MLKMNIAGRLTKEVRLGKSEQYQVTNFTVAVDQRLEGSEKSTTTFIEVAAWNELAGIAAKLKKGQMVQVSIGRISVSTNEVPKKGGKKGETMVFANLNAIATSIVPGQMPRIQNSTNKEVSLNEEAPF